MERLERIASSSPVLGRFARLAATITGAAAVRITLGPEHGSSSAGYGREGDTNLELWFAVPILGEDGSELGCLTVLGDLPAPLSVDRASLQDVAALVAHGLEADRRCAGLERSALVSARADRMLHLVAEAGSYMDALKSMLRELCQHHGAVVGRIWRLSVATGVMDEISRYNDDKLDLSSYYRQPPTVPITTSTSITAQAILTNEPLAVTYSAVVDRERYSLINAAIASGLKCQVSYPIWLQDERFGISFAFQTERTDLDAILADIASLANTIRPALFRKVTDERIRYMAHHDDLTQLANRIVFQERMANAVAAARLGGHGMALLFLDLDGFKPVNDLHGHEVGDRLLVAVAARLRESVQEGDTVARMGGDEFAVLQTLGSQPDAAIVLAERLLDRIGQPYKLNGLTLAIGVSIGIAAFPGDGDSPDELLRNADMALYRAKEGGRHTFRVFEPTMVERQLIQQDLREAIAQQHFALAYQPICDAATLRTVGYEAVLRWDHGTRGLIPPDHFIPIAECTGLILPLGRWALEAACCEAVSWAEPMRLSVNLSPLQFREPHLAAVIADVLARTGFPPDRLDLEVTEGVLLDTSGIVLRTMQALRRQGVGLTLDDFGTMYACLSYLRRFPFDRIKIAKTFIQAMATDKSTLAVVEAIISLSQRLQLSVVAEGLETDEQLDILRRFGCRLVQGYRMGSPTSGKDIAASRQRRPEARHVRKVMALSRA